MKNIILSSLTVFSVISAHASEITPPGNLNILEQQIIAYHKSGAYTYIWILFNAGSQEVEGLGRSWTQYLEIDCNRLGWRNVEFRSYFQPMANGATVFKISKPQEKWQYAEPNKQWSMLLPKLCDLD